MAHVPLMTWKRDSPAFLTWSSKACVDVRLFEEFMLLFEVLSTSTSHVPITLVPVPEQRKNPQR